MKTIALPFKLLFQWLLNTFWKGLQFDILPTPNTALNFIHILFRFDSSATWQAAWLSSNQIQNLFKAYLNGISMDFESLDTIDCTTKHLKFMQISFKHDLNSIHICFLGGFARNYKVDSKSIQIWFQCVLPSCMIEFKSDSKSIQSILEWNFNGFWMELRV